VQFVGIVPTVSCPCILRVGTVSLNRHNFSGYCIVQNRRDSYIICYLKLDTTCHGIGHCTENSATHDAMKAEIEAADRLLTCHIFPK
jgi:hypothetical protein